MRTSIPFRPDKTTSLWSIMKNCIGKELSKIPMPVTFNEPISFTQRLSEDCEYAHLLDEAAATTDPYHRAALVSAFTISSFSSGAWRTGKPFNPLLGETFELDRRATHGYSCILEQVSHHPPICALHATSERGWTFWQDFSMNSKFRGKYLEVVPTGISHIIFHDNDDHFTWTKVSTTIHNIIVGKLWLENAGKMLVTNHTTGVVCELDYKPYSFFSSAEPRTVVGQVKDVSGKVHLTLNGTWDKQISQEAPGESLTPLTMCPEQASDLKADDANGISKRVLWKRTEHVANFEKMYGFTQMAIESNQIGVFEKGCAVTDARFRMDKNVMEQGDFDMANRVKHLLEEGQRFRRRQYEKTQTRWTPCWFELRDDPVVPGRKSHQYKGGYWEAKDSNNFGAHDIVDIYDISPVASKDPKAAEAADQAKTMNVTY
ncbi:uncharacterized protein MONBRDRAFT_17243 [Monosiga brevicollis MX1]|uniref:Oxysterol-binding protein n=1 Tax=Monosiga brevicollis TaxID=81824 RepID=A9UQA5_MONBE|nr:uncharacterized protein MONBRDRAFT_17243 [Monosiga brevicollis MX1]EDQ92562.1 predicted protein [Monosiga brevicollis MX1]|eukprot:XP_001742324.1 hypothetical protein [Monosiga brevicollis MX1]